MLFREKAWKELGSMRTDQLHKIRENNDNSWPDDILSITLEGRAGIPGTGKLDWWREQE